MHMCTSACAKKIQDAKSPNKKSTTPETQAQDSYCLCVAVAGMDCYLAGLVAADIPHTFPNWPVYDSTKRDYINP